MPDSMPDRESAFILVGVGKRGARDDIAAQLREKGWVEGRDFLIAA